MTFFLRTAIGRFQNVLFYIVSDDPEWSREALGAADAPADADDLNFDGKADVYFLGSRKYSHVAISKEIGKYYLLLSSHYRAL